MADSRAAQFVAGMEIPEADRRVVERVALKQDALKASLRKNPYLTTESWSDLFNPKGSVAELTDLASRPLTREQRDKVLAKEARPGVLLGLLDNNTLEADEVDKLLARKKLAVKVASHLLDLSTLTTAQQKAAAWHLGGDAKLQWLASSSPEEMSDEDVISELEKLSEWGPKVDLDNNQGRRGSKGRKAALEEILYRRPSVVSTLVDTNESYVHQLVAGHSTLVKIEDQIKVMGATLEEGPTPEQAAKLNYTYMALVNNPPTDPRVVKAVLEAAKKAGKTELARSAHTRLTSHPHAVTTPFAEISDRADLAWAIKRSLPFESPYDGKIKVRAYDMLNLLANPNLTEQEVSKLLYGIDKVSFRFSSEDLQKVVALVRAEHPEVRLPAYLEDGEFDDVPWGGNRGQHGEPWRPVLDLEKIRTGGMLHQVQESLSVAVHAEIGSDEKRWELFLSLVDTFDGTLKDLVELTSYI